MRGLCVVIIVVLCATLCGCATIYNPATERQEFIFISTSSEVSLGNAIAAKISRQFKISKDSEKINRVNNIGKKLAGVSDRKDLKYHFTVVEDDSLNAFTSPGGYVYIHSALVEKSTDDELACVLGHEIGHVAARHIVKKLQARIGYDILINIAARKSGLGELQRVASISFNLMMLGFSREDELLADRLGVKYAYKAGYDPYTMISFLKKLKDAKEGGVGPVFLRSHPYVSQRIKMLEMQIPTIIAKVDKKSIAKKQFTEGGINLDRASTAIDKKRPLKVMCPVCRRIFSGRTGYCPYDGTRLE